MGKQTNQLAVSTTKVISIPRKYPRHTQLIPRHSQTTGMINKLTSVLLEQFIGIASSKGLSMNCRTADSGAAETKHHFVVLPDGPQNTLIYIGYR